MVLPTSRVAVVSSSVKRSLYGWGQYQGPGVVGKIKCNGGWKGLSIAPDASVLVHSQSLLLPLWSLEMQQHRSYVHPALKTYSRVGSVALNKGLRKAWWVVGIGCSRDFGLGGPIQGWSWTDGIPGETMSYLRGWSADFPLRVGVLGLLSCVTEALVWTCFRASPPLV